MPDKAANTPPSMCELEGNQHVPDTGRLSLQSHHQRPQHDDQLPLRLQHMMGTLRQQPVSGSLQRHLPRWVRLKQASKSVRTMVRDGVFVPFFRRPRPYIAPARPLSSFTAAEVEFIDQELASLQQDKAIRCVGTQAPRCVARLGTAPKKHSKTKLRLITNLRPTNRSVRPPRFRFEGYRELRRMIQQQDYMTTIDLKSGYHHLAVKPTHQTYLGFEWRGQYYVWQVLPFGLSSSPSSFAKALRPVVQAAREQGHRLMAYLDDIIMLGSTREQCVAARNYVVKLLTELGWHINLEKSNLQPSQQAEYLGFRFDTAGIRPTICVPAGKRRMIKHEIRRMLRVPVTQAVSVRAIARIAGLCTSISRAVAPTRMMTRHLYRLIAKRKSWNGKLHISEAARRELEWWIDALDTWNGQAFVDHTAADLMMDTDASDSGWGAVLYLPTGNLHASGFWGVALQHTSINHRELLTAYLAIQAFQQHLRGRTLHLRSDNITTVCYLNRLGSGKIEALADLAQAITNLSFDLDLTLMSTHLPGQLNTIADSLSRRVDKTDWRLTTEAFERLDERWGPHTIDRFASSANRHCPRFDSRTWDFGTETVDTLSKLWDTNDNNFVNAPFALIPTILAHIRRSRTMATVIAPVWPAQPWFRTLLRMSDDDPVLLQQQDFRPGLSGHCEPHKNAQWKLAAFRLSSKSSPRVGAMLPKWF